MRLARVVPVLRRWTAVHVRVPVAHLSYAARLKAATRSSHAQQPGRVTLDNEVGSRSTTRSGRAHQCCSVTLNDNVSGRQLNVSYGTNATHGRCGARTRTFMYVGVLVVDVFARGRFLRFFFFFFVVVAISAGALGGATGSATCCTCAERRHDQVGRGVDADATPATNAATPCRIGRLWPVLFGSCYTSRGMRVQVNNNRQV